MKSPDEVWSGALCPHKQHLRVHHTTYYVLQSMIWINIFKSIQHSIEVFHSRKPSVSEFGNWWGGRLQVMAYSLSWVQENKLVWQLTKQFMLGVHRQSCTPNCFKLFELSLCNSSTSLKKEHLVSLRRPVRNARMGCGYLNKWGPAASLSLIRWLCIL